VAELVWPCVALAAIGCATYCALRLVLSRRAEDELQTQLADLRAGIGATNGRALAAVAQAEKTAEDMAALQQKVTKLEMGKAFGRTG
jgi:hypothetical protein